MAPNQQPSTPKENDAFKDDNPFVAFKKYADEQFASFFQSFVGLPSSTHLHNLERNYFDRNGHSKPIADLLGKSVEAEEPHSEAKQQADRRINAMHFTGRPFMSLISEDFSFDNFERWQRQAERHAEEAANEAKVDRCPYRPAEVEPRMRCPYRSASSEPTIFDGQPSNSLTNAMGLRSLLKDFARENCSNHYAMFRSPFGVAFQIQNIPLSAWPLAYIAMSPYSPLAVERELRNRGENTNVQWRSAFEDLILIHNGHPKEDTKSHNNTEDSMANIGLSRSNAMATTGVQWVQNMFNAGLFGTWHPVDSAFAYNTMNDGRCRFQMSDVQGTNLAWEAHEAELVGLKSEERRRGLQRKDEDSDEMTELDLYEHFLGTRTTSSPPDQRSPAPLTPLKQSFHSGQIENQPESVKMPAPSIISTFTTTQRQVFPDGTVHTKVVLKRRFADGREESNEAEHTTHTGSQVEIMGSLKSKVTGTNDEQTEDSDKQKEQKRKKGWFW